MISYGTGLSSRETGIRSYFPEWANRPAQDGTPLESDHNSYMAGGYAEEFGYDPQQGEPPALPPLDGDPEQSQLWCVQIGGLHPGYPECPRPVDRDAVQPGDPWAARAQPSVVIAGTGGGYRTGDASQRQPVDFTAIRVGERGHTERKHHWLPVALTSRWREFRIRRRGLALF
jgi:hypothetical protein